MQFIITIICLIISTSIFAKGKTNEAYLLLNPSKNIIKTLSSYPQISFDHATKTTIEIYGPEGLKKYLDTLEVQILPLETQRNEKEHASYPTPNEINDKILLLQQQHPEICQVEQIGTSIQGRPIYAIKISDNPTEDETEPEVKYIANMHGDEIVGRELMILLIEELLTKYKSNDPVVTKLINNTEIFIVPSMNPDGAINRRRGNADWVDLNRDFPDFTTRDNENTPHGREVETKSIMLWQQTRNFSLSANFHGGAEVVNYPWDTSAQEHPLHQFVLEISKEYANQVPGMRNSTEFPGGVVNGYDWYEVNGGMQDWSYYWHNDLQVTIELSDTKWPRYSEVARYWEENRTALIDFLGKVHQGIALKLNENEKFVSIEKDGEHIGFFEVKNNEFHKVLPEGYYQITTLDQARNTLKSITHQVRKGNQITNYLSL